MADEPIRVAVTGGAGNISYSLLFRLANGDLFGKEQPIALHILEIPEAANALQAIKMELEDCAFSSLSEVVIGTEAKEVFARVHYAFLIGAKPRSAGQERADLLIENGKIFQEQGRALNEVADRSVKVLVVGNPCNTNCWITMKNAPDIPKENFFAMTRLDHNRGIAALAAKANVPVTAVSCFTIWGNHSTTQVPDFFNAKILDQPLTEVISDYKWLETDFIKLIQNRGAEIISKRGKSSAASAAQAAIDAMKSVIDVTPENNWFSAAFCSDENPYEVPNDLIFSFPCRTTSSAIVQIVPELDWTPFLEEKIADTIVELQQEKETVLQGDCVR